MNTSTHLETYRKILLDEFEKRHIKNPAYSLRSFAYELEVNPGGLSQVLNGKKVLGTRLAKKIVQKLELSPQQENSFFQSIPSIKRNTEYSKHYFISAKEALYMDEVNYSAISEWYYPAILEVMGQKKFKADPKWISQELSITYLQAKLALQQLMHLELIKVTSKGLVRTRKHLKLANPHITSNALKAKQIKIRELAIDSLQFEPMERRKMTTVTMSINPKKLEQAKKMIDEFNQELCDFLEKGEKSEVYALEIGLFPLQKRSH